jgi:hypothetical protein
MFTSTYRVCPGQRVGKHTLFLAFVTIFWALDARQGVDPITGESIPIDFSRETGFAPVGLL